MAALLVVCACGRLEFDSSDGVLAFTDPGAQTEVEGSVEVAGTCRSNLPVQLTGDIATAIASCADGAFSAMLTFTDGDGPKAVTAAQPGATASRMFQRVTPIRVRATYAGSRASAGFMVDCDLVAQAPAELKAGDLLLGAIYTDGGGTGDISTPGFTATAMDGPTHSTFWRIATAAEPASYTFRITAGTGVSDTCESAVVLVAFSSVAGPPIAQASQIDSNDTVVVAPGLTAPKRGVLVGVWGANGPQTGFSQMQMTVADEAYSSGDFASVMIAYEGVQPGPTGDRKADLQQTRPAAAGLFLLDGKP